MMVKVMWDKSAKAKQNSRLLFALGHLFYLRRPRTQTSLKFNFMRPGCFSSSQRLSLAATLALAPLLTRAETTAPGSAATTNPSHSQQTEGNSGPSAGFDSAPVAAAKELMGGFRLGRGDKPNMENANFRMGDVIMDLTGFFSTTYDTNINQSRLAPIWDVIFEAGISLKTYWEISSTNSFSFTTTVSYLKYLRNPQFDSGNNFLNIEPETELAYYLNFGEVTCKIYDRLSYEIEPGQRYFFDPNSASLTTSVQYPRWNNLAGALFGWEPVRDWQMSLNTNRSDTIPDDKRFENLQRTSYNHQLSVEHPINSDLTMGVFGGWTETTYQKNFNNNSKGWNYGYNMSYAFSPFLVGTWRHTFNDMTFERGGFNGDGSDYAGQNFEVGLSHQPSRDISHGLQWSRSSDLGFAANTRETDTYLYYVSYRGLRDGTVSSSYSYASGGDSGGKFAEQFVLRVLTVSYDHPISRKLSFGTTYTHTNKDSNLIFGTHDRDQVLVRLTYDF